MNREEAIRISESIYIPVDQNHVYVVYTKNVPKGIVAVFYASPKGKVTAIETFEEGMEQLETNTGIIYMQYLGEL